MKFNHTRLMRGALACAAAIGLLTSTASVVSAAPRPQPPVETRSSGAYNREAISPAMLGGVQTKWRAQPRQDDAHSCATVKQRAVAISQQRQVTTGALVACGDFTMAPSQAPKTLATIGLGDDPGTDPMPSSCTTPGSKIVGRFADCQVGLIEYELWTVPRKPGEVPKLVGQAAIGVGSMTRTGWKAPGISRILKIKMLEGWGRALSGIKVSADIECHGSASKCKLDDVSKTYVQELSLQRGLYGYANFHSTPTASNDPNKALRHFMVTTVKLRHVNVAEPNPYSASHASESIRCDKRLPTSNPDTPNDEGGCVFADFAPFYNLSKTQGTATETAAHIERAQAATKNHWGKYTGDNQVDKPLTRLDDEKRADDNRDIACPDSLPRPDGKDCDEYPFAATYQGAAMEGRGDYHIEMIDASDNRAEGAYRKNWYADFRMLDRDPFWVNIVS